MKRQVDLGEISDGKLYTANDMVKADCGGCRGCSSCCRGMGESIILDPLDCKRLTDALHISAEALLAGPAELHMADGLILPSLRMDPNTDACTFLDANGRCKVHESRPGFCRLFPLGRYYHDGTFSYFLQIHECRKENRSKIKVKKWLDQPDLVRYETFIRNWHYFLLEMEAAAADEGKRREISLAILKRFYLEPWTGEDFYPEAEARIAELKARFLPAAKEE